MRRRVLRWAAAAVVTSAAVVGLPAGADAVEQPVSGSMSGTTEVAFTACPIIGNTVDVAGDLTTLGTSSLDLLFCVLPPIRDNHWPISHGSFTIATADGTLTGSEVTGFVEPQRAPFLVHLQLTVSGGTGRFEGATGSLALEGVFTFVVDPETGHPTGHAEVTLTGTADVPLPLARTKADCKNGAWRVHADDEGRPFRNQGACVAFIDRG